MYLLPDASDDVGLDDGSSDFGFDLVSDADFQDLADMWMDTGLDTDPVVDMQMDTDPMLDMQMDTDPVVDMQMDTDPMLDMQMDTDQDSGVEICPTPWMDPYVGNCDVVNATGCSATQVCATAQLLQGSTVVLAGLCQTPTTTYDLDEFENCSGTATRCALGLVCFFGTCRKLCYTDDGEGCKSGDFCRQPSETWPGLGYCASQCVGPG